MQWKTKTALSSFLPVQVKIHPFHWTLFHGSRLHKHLPELFLCTRGLFWWKEGLKIFMASTQDFRVRKHWCPARMRANTLNSAGTVKVIVADMGIVSRFCPKTCCHDSAARRKRRAKCSLGKHQHQTRLFVLWNSQVPCQKLFHWQCCNGYHSASHWQSLEPTKAHESHGTRSLPVT